MLIKLQTTWIVNGNVNMETTPLAKRPNTAMEFSPVGKSQLDLAVLKKLLDEKFCEYVSPLKEEISSLKKTLQETKDQSDDACHQLRQDYDLLKKENESLAHQLRKLESQQRRNNLKIFGLKEEKGENLEEKVLNLFNNYLQPGDKFNRRTFERTHRLGSFSPAGNRAMIVKFAHFKDKLLAYKVAENLRTIKVFLADDFPETIDHNRRMIAPLYSALKSMKESHASPHVKTVSRRQDNLFLNGKMYTISDLNQLPEPLQPEKIFTPSKNGITAFFSRYSPFSNFYPAPFEVKGTTYDSMENFCLSKKPNRSMTNRLLWKLLNSQIPSL